MRILAVDTSGMDASLAIADGDQPPGELVLATEGRRHARVLVSAVRDLLAEHALTAAEIDVVAVSIGPGSFTGLRVGVVFAKTFAWINQTRLVAVDTLQGLAQRVASSGNPITVISDAQRDDVFTNAYQAVVEREAMQPLGPVRITRLESLVAQLREASSGLLTGPAVGRFADRLPASLVLAPPELRTPRAAALLPAARELIMKEEWAEPDSLEPVYLRRSYAEEKRKPAVTP